MEKSIVVILSSDWSERSLKFLARDGGWRGESTRAFIQFSTFFLKSLKIVLRPSSLVAHFLLPVLVILISNPDNVLESDSLPPR